MINSLVRVPVTLYRGSLPVGGTALPAETDPLLEHVPIYIQSVSVQHNVADRIVYGNPKDWIARKWYGGTVTCKGLYVPAGSSLTWLTAQFWERISMEEYTQFYYCRVLRQVVETSSVSGGIMALGGTFIFNFQMSLPAIE